MIKVLIVDDSIVFRVGLKELLNAQLDMEVIGTAASGAEALDFLQSHDPDVITMDMIMPDMDGLETTRKIMETAPVPIVIVSASYHADEVAKTFAAINAGAVAILEKPAGVLGDHTNAEAAHLAETVRLMAEVKVVRRWPEKHREATAVMPSPTENWGNGIEMLALGASTGGPQALATVLAGLGRNLPVPILVVQHIGKGFLCGLATWLEGSTGLPVHIATQRLQCLPGHVYLAPDDAHMAVGATGSIILADEAPEDGLRPSVSFLFRSLAKHYGSNALGVLLTGMGRDGAEGLKAMRKAGATTIVQDESSSLVFGMPAEAIRLEAAELVLPLDAIAGTINSRLRARQAPNQSLK